jgi:hypothetical protein
MGGFESPTPALTPKSAVMEEVSQRLTLLPALHDIRVPSTREKQTLQPTSFDSAKGQQATFNISGASPNNAAGKFSAISR